MVSKRLRSSTLEDFIKEAKEIANSKGFHVTWENAPVHLMLVVTELAEAMEAWRDDDRESFREEMADTLIRVFHLCGDLELEIAEAIKRKMEINRTRPYRHGRKRL